MLDERYDEVDDIVRARRVPSMQLVGSPNGRRSTSTRSRAIGVEAGRPTRRHPRSQAQFSGSLRNKCELADLKLGRLLDTIDEWAIASGIDDSVPPPHRFDHRRSWRTHRRSASTSATAEIKTIIWATGFRPDYSWLDVDVLDKRGWCVTTAASSTRPACT